MRGGLVGGDDGRRSELEEVPLSNQRSLKGCLQLEFFPHQVLASLQHQQDHSFRIKCWHLCNINRIDMLSVLTILQPTFVFMLNGASSIIWQCNLTSIEEHI
ncbi:hypothetical protein Vadar_025990 [Vaccinium darrowii]|uniref:Uncharacterized protein n=1 Tax=Vaccinium darrowii TaxID=229202 RepID=A0ACB7Z077_9ERIC|nr:hypothetical protein Vadar_025990 [Vaccinium darrowii]